MHHFAVYTAAILVIFHVSVAGAEESPWWYPTGGYCFLESQSSLLSDAPEHSVLAQTFGYGGACGARWGDWGLFLLLEHNLWRTSELEDSVVPGAVNLAVGVDFRFANGLVHTTMAAGPSFLAYDTLLDKAGSTGVFVEFRPLGLRIDIGQGFFLGIDPLVFAMVAPVLTGVPLVFVQYRTIGFLEYEL